MLGANQASGMQMLPNGDGRVAIQFHLQPVQNMELSQKEGRPIFEDVEHIKITIPGERDVVDRPVWVDMSNPNADNHRFAQAYQAWKTGVQQSVPGTPLSAWPSVTRSQVEELAFFHVRTVEELANMPDSASQKFMGIHALKHKAQDFVDAARGNAPLDEMRAKLEKKDSEIAALQEAVRDQAARLEALLKKKV